MEAVFILLIIVVIIFVIKFLSNSRGKDLPKEKSTNNIVCVKNNLQDFFKINLNNLFMYNPQFTETTKNINGKEIKHYILHLKEIELGTFDRMEIIQVDDNEFNLKFLGSDSELTPELIEFINFCGKKFGPDRSGCTGINNNDLTNTKLKVFSRMWADVHIDNLLDNRMVLTLYGLTQRNVK